jgi:hypothetical protein
MKVVFENSATKLVTKSISNAQIHASNEYMQTFVGVANKCVSQWFRYVSN